MYFCLTSPCCPVKYARAYFRDAHATRILGSCITKKMEKKIIHKHLNTFQSVRLSK